MPGNVIEVVVRTVDEATAPLRNIVSSVEELGSVLTAGIGGSLVAEAFHKFIENTEEAETAQIRLTQAVNNTIEGAFTSAKQLHDFSEEFGKSTIFSPAQFDVAQAALARFDRVYGDTFDRARKDAVDLAAATGTDLVSAMTTLGRALETPTFGMRALAQEGIYFTTQQRALITELDRTGQAQKAGEIILAQVEKTSRGAADAVGNTLGGAFSRVGNAIKTEFTAENGGIVTKYLNNVADGINMVHDAANKPSALDRFIQSLHDLTQTASSVTGQGGALSLLYGPSTDQARPNPQGAQNAVRDSHAVTDFAKSYDALGQLIQQKEADDLANFLATAEIKVGAQPLGDGLTDLFRTFQKNTETDVEQAQQKFDTIKAQLDSLLHTRIGNGPPLISQDEYNARLSAADAARVNSLHIEPYEVTAKKIVEPLTSSQIKFHDWLSDVEGGLTSLLETGTVTGRSITQVFVKAFADQQIKSAVDDLGKYIAQTLQPSTGGTSFLGSLIGAFFGGASGGGGEAIAPYVVTAQKIPESHAGGGAFSGTTWAGEDGPELVEGEGRIYNQRQLAFAAGGGSGPALTYSPVTSIVVQGNADQKTLAIMEARLQQNNKDQLQRFNKTLQNNGYKPLRG